MLIQTTAFMQNDEIIRKINQLLIDEIEIEENELLPAAELKKDLGIDSLDFVDLFVIIEKNFGFKMKAEEMGEIRTLGDFHQFIIHKIYPS